MERKELIDKILSYTNEFTAHVDFRGNQWYRTDDKADYYWVIKFSDGTNKEFTMYDINRYCLRGISIDNIQFNINTFLEGLLKYLESGSKEGFKLDPYLIPAGLDNIREKEKRIEELEKACSDMNEMITGSYVSSGRLDAFEEILNKLLDKPSITFNTK